MAPTTTTTKTESDSSSGSSRPETDRESMHSKSKKKKNNNNNSNNSDSNSNNSDSIPGGAMDTVTILAPTDRDVLCGRGKGIRFHPGNVLFNNLLRKHYHDYGKAPKGSKLEIVKKIVATIREGQAGGIGMFLEQQQQQQAAHDNNPNRSGSGSSGHYRDIGDERAMNKTAQAFRDIRVTEEKKHQQQRYRQQQKTFRQQQQQQHRFKSSSSSSPPMSSSRHNKSPAAIDRAFGSVSSEDEHKNKHKHNHVVRGSSPLLVATTTAARRPTFRERIAMLQRQSAADAETDGSNFCKSKSNDGVDEESGSGSCSELDGEDGDDASVSDTETEDSFPMHRPPGHHTTTNKAMCWSVG